MKKIIFISILLLVVASVAWAEDSQRIYSPERSTIISDYTVRDVPSVGSGPTKHIYRTGEITPRYIVKGGSVYQPSKSLIVPQKSISPPPGGKK